MAYIVALTGGIGSGKTTVSNFFLRYDVTIVDADVIAKELVKPGTPSLEKIIQFFGDKILLKNGSLDRSRLRKKIFSQPNHKTWIHQLLYPLILQEMQYQLAQISSPYVLWVVPLLIENSLQTYANRVLVTDVNIETQIDRTMSRDGISRRQVQDILSSQATREHRLSIADDIIDTNRIESDIELLVKYLHYHYLVLSASGT